ncbi:hypothetical protein LZ30DRAFT_739808 [Colletotrichum cereale]|nr:hypothetical protein LZ30DRAFT_739808 [Colletotrichum cereale]
MCYFLKRMRLTTSGALCLRATMADPTEVVNMLTEQAKVVIISRFRSEAIAQRQPQQYPNCLSSLLHYPFQTRRAEFQDTQPRHSRLRTTTLDKPSQQRQRPKPKSQPA